MAETAPKRPSRHSRPGDAGPQRRCIVRRQSVPADQLLRFVVGPDGTIVPDLAGKLPGRGLWVTARRACIDEACAKNLFQRAARQAVKVAPGLADQVEGLLRQRCLGLIGLARKAGELVLGFEKVSAAAKAGRVCVFVTASDAAADGRGKIERLARDGETITLFTSDDLSRALGRDNVVHIALKDGGLARRLVKEARRLADFASIDANSAPTAQTR